MSAPVRVQNSTDTYYHASSHLVTLGMEAGPWAGQVIALPWAQAAILLVLILCLKGQFFVVFICISKYINDGEHVFICLWAICLSS